MHYFEQKLNDSNILRKNYNLYIDFFTSKLDFENVFKTNELAIYLSAIVCPILINVIPDDKRIESVVLAVLGIFIIPGFIFLINWVINRKKYIYTGIIYYLNLGLLSEQFIESKTTEESIFNGWYPFCSYDTDIKEPPEIGSSIQFDINYDFYKISPDSKIDISISCIVGKNGSGKSSLLELYYRIINNIVP